MGSEDKKKSEDEKSTQKSAIVNPFHARLIAKHQQEAVEKAKQEVEAKAKAQAVLRLEFENSCFRCCFVALPMLALFGVMVFASQGRNLCFIHDIHSHWAVFFFSTHIYFPHGAHGPPGAQEAEAKANEAQGQAPLAALGPLGPPPVAPGVPGAPQAVPGALPGAPLAAQPGAPPAPGAPGGASWPPGTSEDGKVEAKPRSVSKDEPRQGQSQCCHRASQV